MTELVVEVRGGVIVESYSNLADLVVTVVDWDDIEAGDNSGTIPCLPIQLIPEETLAATGR